MISTVDLPRPFSKFGHSGWFECVWVIDDEEVIHSRRVSFSESKDACDANQKKYLLSTDGIDLIGETSLPWL